MLSDHKIHFKIPVILMLLMALLIFPVLSGGRVFAETLNVGDDVSFSVSADKTDLKDGETATVTVTMANDSDYILNKNSLNAVLPDALVLTEGSLTDYKDTIGVGEDKSYSFKVTPASGAQNNNANAVAAITPKNTNSNNPKTGSPAAGILGFIVFLIAAAAFILFMRKRYKASKVLALILVISLCGNFLAYFPIKANAQEVQDVSANSQDNQSDKPAQDYSSQFPMTVNGATTTIITTAHIDTADYLGFPYNGQDIADSAKNYNLECALEGSSFVDKMADLSFAKSHIILSEGAEEHQISGVTLSKDKKSLVISVKGKVKPNAEYIIADFMSGAIENVFVDEPMVCELTKPDSFIDTNHIAIVKTESENDDEDKSSGSQLCLPVYLDCAQFTDTINPSDFTCLNPGLQAIEGAVVTNVDVTAANEANVYVSIPGKTPSEIADEMDGGVLKIDGNSINCDALMLEFVLPVYMAGITSEIVGTPTITDNGDGTATINAVFKETVKVQGDSENEIKDFTLTPESLTVVSTNENVSASAPTDVSGQSFNVAMSTVVPIPYTDETLPYTDEDAQTTIAQNTVNTQADKANEPKPSADASGNKQGDKNDKQQGEATNKQQGETADNQQDNAIDHQQADYTGNQQNQAPDQQQSDKNANVATLAGGKLTVADFEDVINVMPSNLSVTIKAGTLGDYYGVVVNSENLVPAVVGGNAVIPDNADSMGQITTQASTTQKVFKILGGVVLIAGSVIAIAAGAGADKAVGNIINGIFAIIDGTTDAGTKSTDEVVEAYNKGTKEVEKMTKGYDAEFKKLNQKLKNISSKLDESEKRADAINKKIDASNSYRQYSEKAARIQDFVKKQNRLEATLSMIDIPDASGNTYLTQINSAYVKINANANDKAAKKAKNKAMLNLCRAVDARGGFQTLYNETQAYLESLLLGGTNGSSIISDVDSVIGQTVNWDSLIVNDMIVYRAKSYITAARALQILSYYALYYQEDPNGIYHHKEGGTYASTRYISTIAKLESSSQAISQAIKKDSVLNRKDNAPILNLSNDKEFTTDSFTPTVQDYCRQNEIDVKRRANSVLDEQGSKLLQLSKYLDESSDANNQVFISPENVKKMRTKLSYTNQFKNFDDEMTAAGFKKPAGKEFFVLKSYGFKKYAKLSAKQIYDKWRFLAPDQLKMISVLNVFDMKTMKDRNTQVTWDPVVVIKVK